MIENGFNNKLITCCKAELAVPALFKMHLAS